jgi:hypothetical protein
LVGVALVAVVAAVVLVARGPDRTVVVTRNADASTGSDEPGPDAPGAAVHLEGSYAGTSDYVIATPSCAEVDTVLDAAFAVTSGEVWQLHNRYCGTITDGRFTASGTFTFTLTDGSTLSGASQTTDVVLADNGGPVELTITNGEGRYQGATGSCSLANTVRNLGGGHQEQSGSFRCDVVPTVPAPPADTSTTTTTASSPLPEVPPCRSDQLAVQLVGIQGTSQHLVGSYWIADSSPDVCELAVSAIVDLLDANGDVLASISSNGSDTPTRLNPSTILAPDGVTSRPGIAEINLWWAANDIAAGGSPCQQPTLRPAAVRFHIGDATVTTNEVASGTLTISVCGEDLTVVGPSAI